MQQAHMAVGTASRTSIYIAKKEGQLGDELLSIIIWIDRGCS
jgi:hypothetical protein